MDQTNNLKRAMEEGFAANSALMNEKKFKHINPSSESNYQSGRDIFVNSLNSERQKNNEVKKARRILQDREVRNNRQRIIQSIQEDY